MAQWIWYRGDFEIRQGLLQNCVREERGMRWPAYWYMDDCRKNVKLFRTYNLLCETSFEVTLEGIGYVRVNDRKARAGERITCGPGETCIEIFVCNPEGLPAAYVEGDIISSDDTWSASDMAGNTVGNVVRAGVSSLYTEKGKQPDKLWFVEEEVPCVDARRVRDSTGMTEGCLYEFAKTVTGVVKPLRFPEGKKLTFCYGESAAEAVDIEGCYYWQKDVEADSAQPRRAFRFLFVPGIIPGELELCGIHQSIPYKTRGFFHGSDERLNRIWDVSEETFRLSSTLFILDGIKRDQWIWSGDAYQSLFVERYLFCDDELIERTLTALRGQDSIRQHMNTIVDYSMLWIQAVGDYYRMSGSLKFLEDTMPKILSMLEYCLAQTNVDGMLYAREGDWIFVDWAPMDKGGILCAEQMLLAGCLNQVADLLEAVAGTDAASAGMKLGREAESETGPVPPRRTAAQYRSMAQNLTEAVQKRFWREERGAFVDCAETGREFVSRQSNVWAIRFGIATPQQKASIIENVICNNTVPAITTPYFKFYELDILAGAGYLKQVYKTILGYWGGMLDQGAVTFWEEYDPAQTGDDKYGMYGDPFGKSLCHAWAASPIYMIGRYFVGLYPTSPGFETYRLEPQGLELLDSFEATLPVHGGRVEVVWKEGKLTVETDRDGGEVLLGGQRYPLRRGERTEVSLRD